jgi:hypothetical protein
MKYTLRRIAALGAALASFQLAATNAWAASQSSVPQISGTRGSAPKVILAKSTLSTEEMAKYQQKSAQSRRATNDKAAGASGNKTAWVVVGVAAVAGAVALASSGGGGGGGGY